METIQAKLPRPEAMIFDMDGTLFKTETLLIPVYHKVFDRLREENLYTGDTPPDELMLSSLGMLLEDIWKKVIPDCSEIVHHRANELLLELELEGLEEGQSELYPHVKETLEILRRRGVRLFVASNGLEDYVKGVAQTHGISPFFEAMYSAGEYLTESKVDLVKLLMGKYSVTSAWMVGDRSSDVEAGKKNGQIVIGCSYAGFGQDKELDGSDILIHSFDQIIELYDESIE